MTRRLSLAVVLALLVAALVAAQRQHAAAPAGGQSLLYLIADSERDLVAMPAHFTRISDADEVKYGDRLAKQLSSGQSKRTDDKARIDAYLAEVGKRIAPHAHRRLPYRFHYITDRQFVNAFALPGGHVFVGSGLLERMTTEDELASVVAHEIEHVDHYHCAERLQVEAALRKIPLGSIAAIPVAVFQAGYNKDQELEADREGVLLAAAAGYSANGAVRAFEMLARLYASTQERARTPQREAARVAVDVLSGYFRTHPLPDERLAQVRTMIARQPTLAAVPERRLGVDYIVLAWNSLDAVADEQFPAARAFAARALAIQPGHPAALQGLAEADDALEQFNDANAAYRQLLARDPARADAVEKWAEQRARKLYERREYDRAIALAGSVLAVQPGQPALLRIAAFAHAMKGDSAAAAAAGESIHKLYPESIGELGGEAESEATKLVDSGAFAEAAAMANLAMALDLSRKSALAIRGTAELAQANFAAAAKTFADQFDPENSGVDWLRAYAIAVGTARPQSALAELQSLLANRETTRISEGALRVERAGLALMGGSNAEALDVVQRVNDGSIAPELLARLGWWSLQAHRADMAAAVLDAARKLRPGDADVQNALAWLSLEMGKPTGAIAPTESQSADPLRQNGRDVRETLAAWQQGRASDAIRDWTQAVRNKPQWLNPAWRAAIYPPRIAATAAAIEAERQRRAAIKEPARTAAR